MMDMELVEGGAPDESLQQRALLAWRRELEKAYQVIEEDKQTEMRRGVFRKLVSMFGPGHLVELEPEAQSTGASTGAVVEGLRFLGLRAPSGEISVHLLARFAKCDGEMAGDRLTSLADLGRELVELRTKGVIGEHECPISVAAALHQQHML
jgi:hypothetical protein